jgi:hypothetical protein
LVDSGKRPLDGRLREIVTLLYGPRGRDTKSPQTRQQGDKLLARRLVKGGIAPFVQPVTCKTNGI